ncbi:MAG: DUF1858 domain-containing protein, partial [Candidatus Zixiibacteriota bacterium]
PELEEVLINAAPSFAKLRSPLLRRTVARVTSLRQAAIVGGVELGILINTLRRAAGQTETEIEIAGESMTGQTAPGWFDERKIWRSLDARSLITAGQHPLDEVFKNLKEMPEDKIFELITPFVPAPLLDKAVNIGYTCWYREEAKELFKTYFFREKNKI